MARVLKKAQNVNKLKNVDSLLMVSTVKALAETAALLVLS